MGLWQRLARGAGAAVSASTSAPWTLHVFGKVPSQGDFVRLSLPAAEDEGLVALEHWVARTIEETSAELAPRWPALLHEEMPVAHLHRLPLEGGGHALVAAASLPSVDAVGRRFPLVACARLPAGAFEQTPHLVPMALVEFLREAVPLLAEARALPVAELRRRVAAQRLAPLPHPSELVLDYGLWAHGTTVGRCALQLFGADVGELARVIACVAEAIVPLGRLAEHELASTPLALRFPVAIDPFYAAFWIDVVRRIARWRTTVPTYLAAGDDARGALIVAVGEAASPTLLADAWGARAPSRSHVRDVETTAANRASLPAALRTLLAAPDAPLDQLLAAISTEWQAKA